jgi:hypothetical protein
VEEILKINLTFFGLHNLKIWNTRKTSQTSEAKQKKGGKDSPKRESKNEIVTEMKAKAMRKRRNKKKAHEEKSKNLLFLQCRGTFAWINKRKDEYLKR